jgi:hypothetical protein
VLVERVADALDSPWDKGTERPRSLVLARAVKAALIYLRHNVTEELLAAFMETASRPSHE